jgi:hypothetical protein
MLRKAEVWIEKDALDLCPEGSKSKGRLSRTLKGAVKEVVLREGKTSNEFKKLTQNRI